MAEKKRTKSKSRTATKRRATTKRTANRTSAANGEGQQDTGRVPTGQGVSSESRGQEPAGSFR